MIIERCCRLTLVLSLAAIPASAQVRPEADLCAVPPGAQPLLPARLMTGMGVTNMPVTTTSEEARKFFNQGISQMHSFWFLESERSFLQAATLDPNMAMAYWGMSVSAAGDYRPAFQLLRDPTDGGRQSAPDATSAQPVTIARSTNGAALSPQVRSRENAQKAMALRDKVTPRERLYIESEWARRDPATKTHDADYIAVLRTLVTAYPDDEEAKSILGLALLDGFDSANKAPRAHTMEGIAMLEAVVGEERQRLRRPSLSDPRLRRQQDAREGLARLRALPGTRHEHSTRAAHARAYLRAERQESTKPSPRFRPPPATSSATSRAMCSIQTATTATTSTSSCTR